jgi:hypothetical protein
VWALDDVQRRIVVVANAPDLWEAFEVLVDEQRTRMRQGWERSGCATLNAVLSSD